MSDKDTAPMGNTPVSHLGPMPPRDKCLVYLMHLYAHNKDDLFWVLHNVKLRIQNDEASALATRVIRKAMK